MLKKGKRLKQNAVNESDKDTIISALSKENRQLKIQIMAYEKQTEHFNNLIHEQEEINIHLENLKMQYESKLRILDALTEEYKKQLDKILQKTQKANIRK